MLAPPLQGTARKELSNEVPIRLGSPMFLYRVTCSSHYDFWLFVLITVWYKVVGKAEGGRKEEPQD